MAVTFTEYHDRAMMVVKAEITMTTTDPETFGPTTHSYYGFVVQCFVDETDAPNDNYDITINDEFGVDVLNGKGQNLTADTVLTQTDLDNGMACSGQLSFIVEDPTNDKTLTVYLYIARYQ